MGTCSDLKVSISSSNFQNHMFRLYHIIQFKKTSYEEFNCRVLVQLDLELRTPALHCEHPSHHALKSGQRTRACPRKGTADHAQVLTMTNAWTILYDLHSAKKKVPEKQTANSWSGLTETLNLSSEVKYPSHFTLQHPCLLAVPGCNILVSFTAHR